MRIALLAVLCLVAAGCGGDSEPPPSLTKAQYETQAGQILREMSGEPRTFNPESIDDETQRGADRLRELVPPVEIRDQHELLVAGLDALAEDLRAAQDAQDGGPGELQAALDRVAGSPGGKQAEDALREIEERGYRLPPVFGV